MKIYIIYSSESSKCAAVKYCF